MMYRIARGGQTFGPYTDAEMRQYISSGNIALGDMVQVDQSGEWIPVRNLFPPTVAASAVPPVPAMGPRVLYPDPPDFPWWGALLLGLVTGGVFFVVWDIVEASWMKRVEKNSTALLLYIGVAILYLFKLPSMWSVMNYNMFGGPNIHTHSGTLGSAGFILAVVARFVFRRELLDHFNNREHFPLKLNTALTLIFGGLYFQYEFNRINQTKRLTNTSVSAV